MGTVIKNVTVLGASGNMGPTVLSGLKEAGFKISVVTRLSSITTFPSDVTVHKSDYSSSSLVSCFKGQDAIVSTIAATNVSDQKKIIDAAIAAGVKRFLPSEFGGDSSIPNIEKLLPFSAGKNDVVGYLKTKESEGLSWTAIYTGIFIDWAMDVGGFGWDLPNLKVTIYDTGDARFDCTEYDTVGKAIASSLKHFESTRNQHVYINSFQLTQNQVVTALERLTGKKFETPRASSIKLGAKGREYLAQGDWKGFLPLVTASIHAPWGFMEFGERPAKWNAVLELPEGNLDATLERVLRKKNLI